MYLLPGDIIVSYKKPNKWNLFQKFFDWILILKSKHKYGKKCKFPKANHTRIYVGIDPKDKLPKVFEWTFPRAKLSKLQNWMLSPTYSKIYRFIGIKKLISEETSTINYFVALNEAIDSIYDWGQLFDIAFGFKFRLFDLGKNKRVCSTGVRWLLEFIYRINTMPDIQLNRTLPCSFANEKQFELINKTEIKNMLPEPEEV